MNIYIKGRNLRVTEALRKHVEEQVGRLERHYDRILDAHVTLRAERAQRIVDVTLYLPHHLIKAEERSASIDASIDLVRDRLEKQLKKYKTRLIGRRHKLNGKMRPGAATQAGRRNGTARIARTKRMLVKSMSPSEAALQMELLGHDFFVFLNADTDEINVLYRRKAGDFGLIEPVI
jgi:putative sigma-54 modulation protein